MHIRCGRDDWRLPPAIITSFVFQKVVGRLLTEAGILPNMRINAKLNSFQLAGIDRILMLWKSGPKVTTLNDILILSAVVKLGNISE